MQPATEDGALLKRVEQFIYREARLQDEHRYAEWEALWTDDGIYWVPANGDNIDPEQQMSIIYDNRSRIGVRVRQLLSGKRHTQEPRSRLRHLVTNVELLGRNGAETNNEVEPALGGSVWRATPSADLADANDFA